MSGRCRGAIGAIGVLAALLVGAAPAGAAEPWWHVTSVAIPTHLPPGGEGVIFVEASNLGDATIDLPEKPVTITDTLPKGLRVIAIRGGTGQAESWSEAACSVETVSCEFNGSSMAFKTKIPPPYLKTLPPFRSAGMEILVKVKKRGESGENDVAVAGGGAPPASISRPVTISAEPLPFGVESYEFTPQEEGGALDTQAGSHPFELTTTFKLNTVAAKPLEGVLEGGENSTVGVAPVALTKDLHFVLPAGLVGNPTPLPQCTEQQFTTPKPGLGEGNNCPADTTIGGTTVTVSEPALGPYPIAFTQPLFNLVPSPGEPARFGFTVANKVPVILDTSLRTGGEYNVQVDVHDISQITGFLGSEVTFWGVPGDARHDNARGSQCVSQPGEPGCNPLGEEHPPPFLMLPTSCASPLETTMQADSWAAPGVFTAPLEPVFTESLDGCNRLSFEPSVRVTPDGQAASTPTGLTVDAHVPQQETLVANGLAPADVQGTTVALPAGVALNPAGADGLLACSLGQIALEAPTAGICPNAAKVGTVEIKTPLLPEPLVGAVYLAAQEENPFGSLIALYLVAEDPTAGVVVKIAGQVTPDPATGQLVSTFPNTPQLPFEDVALHFFGGARAPLATPPRCGSYQTQASFTPWSGNAPVASSSTFQVTSGPNEAPCADPLPFAPSLQTGSLNLQASAFTPFTLTMSREDGNQSLQGIQLKLPSGLLGDLAHVQLCEEPQAQEGTCGPESLIGETTVSVGLGGSPYTVSGGKVYITGPYGNAPYGLTITNPAKAGPFDLERHTACDCVVVRAAINVDPRTAALTITSYPLPTILQGIPLAIKHVNVTIDRPQFTFNPSDCEPQAITGTLSSAEGAASALRVPFQVANCATLSFKPRFSATASGHTSKARGASLDVRLSYPSAPQGTQTNVARVKVALPKQLPSRLTTLQKACPAAVFEANPGSCPAASVVGYARATTPVLPDALFGPAYFVSYGGAKFPELVVVLEADRVRVDLHGETLINAKGVTSSTFSTLPDVPLEAFELYLPQGPYSALTANTNLCRSALSMPTEFVAKDGAAIHQSTPVAVTGCGAKAKRASRARIARGWRRGDRGASLTRQIRGHGEDGRGRRG